MKISAEGAVGKMEHRQAGLEIANNWLETLRLEKKGSMGDVEEQMKRKWEILQEINEGKGEEESV